ncbi:energy transducer TonB [Rhodanobacter sp. OK091]|uniref:energy transducer TonB n=1 Tax=Rhodanobacter sp. OK091 TaxID=1881037 RepID=UPI00090F4ACE|nr:energy transducer TonB [Rhodanobacter sp. OK091]SHM46504.1 outer membrane transport energization protein TonB [Rhodanobacter sp. OK091]
MSSASLAVAHRPHPDSARIAALSAAMALNLAVILIATRPITPAQLAVVSQLTPASLIRIIDPPAVLPPPLPVELKPLPHPPIPPRALPRPTPVSPPVVMPSEEGRIAAPPISAPTLLPSDAAPGAAVAAPAIEASLAYRVAPLRFPAQARQQRMHGTVLLRVLVDETGKPLQVTVEQGSGYALLDRSARDQVLAGWRFLPAMVNGQAVRAWARVPVSFQLLD